MVLNLIKKNTDHNLLKNYCKYQSIIESLYQTRYYRRSTMIILTLAPTLIVLRAAE